MEDKPCQKQLCTHEGLLFRWSSAGEGERQQVHALREVLSPARLSIPLLQSRGCCLNRGIPPQASEDIGAAEVLASALPRSQPFQNRSVSSFLPCGHRRAGLSQPPCLGPVGYLRANGNPHGNFLTDLVSIRKKKKGGEFATARPHCSSTLTLVAS